MQDPRIQRNESQDEEPRRVVRLNWPPSVGIGLGIIFIIAGVLIFTRTLGAQLWLEDRIRIIMGSTVILYGIWRIAIFLPKLNRKRTKTLREQINDLDQK